MVALKTFKTYITCFVIGMKPVKTKTKMLGKIFEGKPK